MKPSGHAGAAREGLRSSFCLTDKQPPLTVHRPSCGGLGTPWEALRGFLCVSPAGSYCGPSAVSTFWRRKPGYRMVGAENHSSTPSGRAGADNTALAERESNPARAGEAIKMDGGKGRGQIGFYIKTHDMALVLGLYDEGPHVRSGTHTNRNHDR